MARAAAAIVFIVAFAFALAVALMQVALAAPPPDPDESPYGICAHIPSDAAMDRLAAAGVVWLRCDFNWVSMEPHRKGAFDWAETDRLVASARARGQRIFATLAYTPGWANGGRHHRFPPNDVRDWTDFVAACVNRYKGDIQHWGMWNEPNLSGFFEGSRTDYIDRILKPGAAAAKAADPTCSVLGPELAHLVGGRWDEWLEDVMRRASDSIDIVSHHMYKGDAPETFLNIDGRPWRGKTVKWILDRYGRGQELWLTEVGWNTGRVSEAHQAREYPRLLGGVLERSYLTKVFFYEATDDPSIPDKWGILRADLTPKPSYGSYRAFTAANPDAGGSLRFRAVGDLAHLTGRAAGGGWEAVAGRDGAAHMAYGPYTTAVAPGSRTAVFRLALGGSGPGDERVATLDVYDPNARRTLARRDLSRGDFRSGAPHLFRLSFGAAAGQTLEFRVYWHGRGTLRLDEVEVRAGRDIKGQRGWFPF